MDSADKRGIIGETSLFGGSKVPKDDPRIVALGEVDELDSILGWCRCIAESEALSAEIKQVQRDLYLLEAELATPADAGKKPQVPVITRDHYSRLEDCIERARGITGPINQFVTPGGTELSCRLHIARTCCRRAERSAVRLNREAGLREELLIYLDRLSDLLFAWSQQVGS